MIAPRATGECANFFYALKFKGVDTGNNDAPKSDQKKDFYFHSKMVTQSVATERNQAVLLSALITFENAPSPDIGVIDRVNDSHLHAAFGTAWNR